MSIQKTDSISDIRFVSFKLAIILCSETGSLGNWCSEVGHLSSTLERFKGEIKGKGLKKMAYNLPNVG